MRILLTGGGSGGHVFPLVAVARKIIELSSREDAPSPEFLFVGPDRFSKEVFRQEGIPAKVIWGAKVRRYFSFQNFLDVLKFPFTLVLAYVHTFLFMPDVIFAKGGYGSAPVTFWGWVFRIPIVIHESDAVPGIANRILAKFAKIIIVSFDATVAFFPKHKTLVLGNPIRDELFRSIPKESCLNALRIHSKRPVIFVLGGSQGAQEINELMLGSAARLAQKYEIVHQCGEKNFETIQKGMLLMLGSEEERAFYHLYSRLSEVELAAAYFCAGIVVSRAGSGAIFEIAASGKPSILVPYDASAGNHQEKNAHLYAETGAALVLEGENLTHNLLADSIERILENPATIKSMSDAARNFAKPDAARKIVEELLTTFKTYDIMELRNQR